MVQISIWQVDVVDVDMKFYFEINYTYTSTYDDVKHMLFTTKSLLIAKLFFKYAIKNIK